MTMHVYCMRRREFKSIHAMVAIKLSREKKNNDKIRKKNVSVRKPKNEIAYLLYCLYINNVLHMKLCFPSVENSKFNLVLKRVKYEIGLGKPNRPIGEPDRPMSTSPKKVEPIPRVDP